MIAGPYSAALLGDLGADVIKLERPGRGDDMRSFRGDGLMSAAFAAVNRNKRSLRLDLSRDEGRDVLRREVHRVHRRGGRRVDGERDRVRGGRLVGAGLRRRARANAQPSSGGTLAETAGRRRDAAIR